MLVATAIAYAARAFDLVDLLLVIGGALVLPVWLVWTGRLLREESVAPGLGPAQDGALLSREQLMFSSAIGVGEAGRAPVAQVCRRRKKL